MVRLSCTRVLWHRGIVWAGMILLATSAVAEVRQTSGVLSRGTRWETPYYVQQSDQPGPTVVLVGGVHGDEAAGAAAADQIRRWPITRGILAVLPRANPPSLAAHTRLMPEVDKEQNNLNRNFPKAGQPGLATGEPAQAIWSWLQFAAADLGSRSARRVRLSRRRFQVGRLQPHRLPLARHRCGGGRDAPGDQRHDR